MRERVFGGSGVKVPVIGQGTWQLRDPEAAEASLRLGLDLGLRHVDTAELYVGSEEVVGRAVAGRRDDAFVVSKVLPRNASYEGTKRALEASLGRLGMDHVDAYLLHWWSGAHPIEDTMRAMGELADEGRTRFVGVSNLDVGQLEAAQQALGKRHRIVCDQVYYDLQHRHVESTLLPYCLERNIAVVGYSPFGSGSGKDPAGSKAGRDALARVASKHEATPHQVVLNFLTGRDGVFLIPKAEREEHVRANAASLDFELDEEDVESLERAFPVPREAPGLPMV